MQPPANNHPRLHRQPILWVALIALVLAALAVTTYMALHQPAAKPQTAKPSEAEEAEDYLEHFTYEATVRVGADGFNPATLRVKPDTKIFWEATDSTPHHIVATPGSPVAKYFVSTTAIKPGQPYSARFTDPGTYSYHDADHPSFNGVVIVAP